MLAFSHPVGKRAQDALLPTLLCSWTGLTLANAHFPSEPGKDHVCTDLRGIIEPIAEEGEGLITILVLAKAQTPKIKSESRKGKMETR